LFGINLIFAEVSHISWVLVSSSVGCQFVYPFYNREWSRRHGILMCCSWFSCSSVAISYRDHIYFRI